MKNKTRIRMMAPVVSTRAEAESMLGEIALAAARRDLLEAELRGKLAEIRQGYEGEIDALGEAIEQKSGLLQQWAEGAPEEFFGKKSIEFLHGRIGFRTGTPKLKTISGWTFGRVQGVLTGALMGFLRKKEEVDKEGILGAYAQGKIGDAALRSVGLRVVQEEAFFVEPKVEGGER